MENLQYLYALHLFSIFLITIWPVFLEGSFFLITSIFKNFSLNLLLSDTFFIDPRIDVKDGGKHIFAQLVAGGELMNVFTKHS